MDNTVADTPSTGCCASNADIERRRTDADEGIEVRADVGTCAAWRIVVGLEGVTVVTDFVIGSNGCGSSSPAAEFRS